MWQRGHGLPTAAGRFARWGSSRRPVKQCRASLERAGGPRRPSIGAEHAANARSRRFGSKGDPEASAAVESISGAPPANGAGPPMRHGAAVHPARSGSSRHEDPSTKFVGCGSLAFSGNVWRRWQRAPPDGHLSMIVRPRRTHGRRRRRGPMSRRARDLRACGRLHAFRQPV
jgi:hypothetical protein